MALWRTQKRNQKVIVGFNKKNNKPIYKDKVIYGYDDIKLFNVEPRHLLFDYNAQSIEDCVDAAYDRVVGKEDFLDTFGNNPHVDGKLVLEAYKTGSTQHSFETKEETRDRRRDEMVNLVDYFNIVEDKYMIIANGFVIYEAPMPIKMIPITHYKNRLKLGSFYSMSERDIIKDIIEEKDVHRNMIIDYNKFNIHSPILTNMGVEIDEESLEFAPGAIWRVGDVNQVSRLQMGNIINSPFSTESMFDGDITKALGVDVNALVSGQEESATRTISKKRNQLSRLEPMLKYNSLTADVRLVKIIMEYVDTFYSLPVATSGLTDEESALYNKYREARVDDFEVEMTGNGLEFHPKKGAVSFFDITPDLLGGEFDIRVATSGEIPVSKELKQQKAMELLQVVNTIPLNPQDGKVPPHIQPILKMLLESGDFNPKDFETLFNDAEIKPEEETPESILAGMGIQNPIGNKTPGRAATPQEMVGGMGQASIPDMTNGAELGQVTSMNAGI
jgi:hypothetical protein